MSSPPPPDLVTVGAEFSGSVDDVGWAWARIVANHRPWMLRLAMMKCGNEAIAEDAVANVLTWICEERHRFVPEHLQAVLRTRVCMAVHVLMRSRARRHAMNASWLQERPRHEPSVEAQCHEQELLGKLETALDTIPARRRRAFELVKMEGRSYAEAGEVMGLKGAVVKNYVRAALGAPAMEALREFLVGEVEGRG